MSNLPNLPCPECRVLGIGGGARIGSNRNRCKLCNRYGQSVMRQAGARLRSLFPAEYRRAYEQVERDTYPVFVEQWLKENPDA